STPKSCTRLTSPARRRTVSASIPYPCGPRASPLSLSRIRRYFSSTDICHLLPCVQSQLSAQEVPYFQSTKERADWLLSQLETTEAAYHNVLASISNDFAHKVTDRNRLILHPGLQHQHLMA